MLNPKPWRKPIAARSHSEAHRQASWLELFFDLSFVVAVAQAAVQLEHALAEGHISAGITGFLIVFAAIWWAWMAFTWFANVFDTDDVPYRLLSMVMIAGSLGLAAGVPQIAHLDFRIGVTSYVVMRLAYVTQWIRVYRAGYPEWRPVAARIAALTTINQIGWVLFLWVPDHLKVPVFITWFAADLATPYLAGWDARMGGHRHHIVERYGLFAIIVLGESVAAATVAIGQAAGSDGLFGDLLLLALGGLLCVFSLWWIYFDFTSGSAPARERRSQYLWGYLHYLVFASLAALGAGLALCAAWLSDPEHVTIDARGIALVVGVSVSAFLLSIAAIESLTETDYERWEILAKVAASASMILVATAEPWLSLPGSIMSMGIVLAALVALGAIVQHRRQVELTRAVKR